MNTPKGWAERTVSEMSSSKGECRAGGDYAFAPAQPPDSFISNRSFELLREMNLRFGRRWSD
eukprot:4645133-Pleurochrysis_carterae.AAC.1